MQKTQLKAGYYFIKIKGQDGVKIAQSPGIRLGEGKFGKTVYNFMLFGGRNFLNLDSVESILKMYVPEESQLLKSITQETIDTISPIVTAKTLLPKLAVKKNTLETPWLNFRGLIYKRQGREGEIVEVRKDKVDYKIGDQIGTKGYNGKISSFELTRTPGSNGSYGKTNIIVKFKPQTNNSIGEQTVLLQNIFKFQ